MQANQVESGKTSDPVTWPESQSETYKKLITYYLELKNKLVNGKDANSEAGKMLDNLNQIDMDAFSPKGHEQYMNYHKKIARSTRSIKNAETLQAQRNSFIQLSEAIIDMVQNFRNQESKLYVQFCPMADANQGAFWLSSEKQIRNPYYGESMLTCGEVREELKGK
jgi:Cu(I)/Ag(I) efflux system membrane fusion protein